MRTHPRRRRGASPARGVALGVNGARRDPSDDGTFSILFLVCVEVRLCRSAHLHALQPVLRNAIRIRTAACIQAFRTNHARKTFPVYGRASGGYCKCFLAKQLYIN